MKLSRRRLLQVGTAGAAILALGGLGLGLADSALATPVRPLQALDLRAFSVLQAVCRALLPVGAPWPDPGELQTAEHIDAVLAGLDPGDAADLSDALGLLENALVGLLFDGRPKPFTQCSPEVQRATLDRWRTSHLALRRKVYKALRSLVAEAYYAHPQVALAMGYPGMPDYGNLPAAPAPAPDPGGAG